MISLTESILGSTRTGVAKYLDLIDRVLKEETSDGHWRTENTLIWVIYLHPGGNDFSKYCKHLRGRGNLVDPNDKDLEEFYKWMKTNTDARVTWNNENDIIIHCNVGDSNFIKEMNKIFCRYYDNIVVI